MTPSIQLSTGRYFDITKPRVEDVDIEFIVHALSNLCRFTGHCNQFYSVAQHSYLVAEIVPPKFALYGLLHDAAEAVMGDVSSPLKSVLPACKSLEYRVHATMMDAFGLPWPIPDEVKHADLVALATEKRDLMSPSDIEWDILKGIEPRPHKIRPWTPAEAKTRFRWKWNQLKDKNVEIWK